MDLVNPPFVSLFVEKIRFAARGHINWVFTKAERPHGFWHRSYLINGECKDRYIFQLDQQCYPLLELCDYLEYFPDEMEFVKGIVGRGVIQEILAVLERKQDAKTQLWPTDETPGDDAVIYPHHFSSHVLLWRTFTRLHELFVRLGIPRDSQTSRLGDLAADLKERTMRSFTSSHPSCAGNLFAYLTDGCGNFTFYHDGNDIPTSFAHEWGFVSTTDEICTWKNTMAFGLSPANTDGYCNESPYGGLGSVHSPGAWSLGYYQELAYAAATENVLAMQSTWNKIAVAMQWDGTFPEAVDPKTAECTSKAWFSWPGAMIGALLIRMRKNGQEKLLLQNMHGQM
jgi:meiotically up-regulated gene 157 (Mug157) protein